MKFSFPISKTEPLGDGRLLVEGIATSDAIDLQNERLLFDGSVKALSKWLETGPAVREQHDPAKAVGRGMEMIPLTEEKAIKVRVFVSKGAPETQAKVMDGTLAAFSVGGEPKAWEMKKHGKKSVREISDWDMHELSLVDRPANPDCRIDLVKNDRISDAVAKGADMAEENEKEPVDEKPDGDKPPEETPEKEPEVEPEGEKEPEGNANAEADEPAISEKEMAQIVDAVLSALDKNGALAQKAAPEPEIKKDASMAAWDIRAALDLLCGLEGLYATEKYEVMSGEAEPPEQLALLDSAIVALRRFIQSEAGEMTEPDPVVASARAARMAKRAAPAPVPQPDERIADVLAGIAALSETLPASLSKAQSDLKAVLDGEIKALRENDLKSLRAGMEQILSMPVPGRTPLRFQPPETVAKSVSDFNTRVSILEEMAGKADAVTRPAIERELAFVRAQIGAR